MTSLRLVARAFVMMLALAAWPALADTIGAPTQHLAMRLVAESTHPKSGAPLTVAIDTRPEQGWHGYWENPGDAGFPTRLTWTLPKGVTASEPSYPVPATLLIAGIMNHVYEAPYAPLVTLTVPAGLAIGTVLPIRVKLDYLVCTSTICVPEDQSLAVDLTIGDGAIDAGTRGDFERWRRAIPKPLDAVAHYAAGKDGALRIAIPYPAGAAANDPHFFPVTTGVVDNAAPQTVVRNGDMLTIATKGKVANAPLDGVLRIGAGQGLRVHAVPGPIGDAGGDTAPARGVLVATLVAFAGAVLGGLILNIMPCVFPILSLKALSLARGHTDTRTARRDALAYTAGVVLVLLALGGAILALRAGGSAIGWAFQLQDPRAIVVLLLLSVAIALNLSGLFEMPMPRFAGNSGVSGSFATGALAAFVATPCTGPFMGAALGAALVLPWPAALAVFGGLGLGLALPFLAIGFVPALRRRLPKPGAWMETFRRILSVPMWLTAIALAWVLGRQSGVDAQSFALLVAMGLGFVLWWAGTRQRRGEAAGLVLAIGLIVVLAVGVAALPKAAPHGEATVAGTTRFSEAKLAELRKSGRPVFAYFTADWCLTCKVNEKAAIETAGVRDAFARHKVAVLLGDWTDGDPALGRFIQAHNRAGVPLYLYYAPGAAEPQVLPQVLTPGMLEALGGCCDERPNVMDDLRASPDDGDLIAAPASGEVPEHVAAAIRTLIEWAGDDPSREGLVDTPRRVAKAWREYCAGYADDPAKHLERVFEEVGGYDEIVLLKDIPFQSHCEHHMAPIIGRAHIAYLPRDHVVGISKLARVLHGFARRLQVQERLTAEVADCIWDNLKPHGVAVVIEASHACMTARGVRTSGVSMVTSRMMGVFRDDERSRKEVLALMGQRA